MSYLFSLCNHSIDVCPKIAQTVLSEAFDNFVLYIWVALFDDYRLLPANQRPALVSLSSYLRQVEVAMATWKFPSACLVVLAKAGPDKSVTGPIQEGNTSTR